MSKSSSSQTTTNSVPGMGPQEQKIVDALQGVGVDQASALKMAMSMAQNGSNPNTVALNATDQAALDQAYSGANADLQRQANIMKQDLAGTRGLNGSDTPVSDSVIREFAPQFANLASAKANQGLGLGLNLAQMGQQNRQFNLQSLLYGSQGMPGAFSFLGNRFQNERFANGTTTQRGSQTPSIMDSIGKGVDIGSKILSMGGSAMAGFGGASPSGLGLGGAPVATSGGGFAGGGNTLGSFNAAGSPFLVNMPKPY